nr:MAG TPA: dockerin-like protein [Caudoviricetes sp.]
MYFSFYDFEYTNHNIEIAQYHKGENYNLYVSNDDGFITLAELKEMSQMMTKVKAVADEVIGVASAKGNNTDE